MASEETPSGLHRKRHRRFRPLDTSLRAGETPATWLDTPGFAPCGAGRGVFPEHEFPERLIFNFVSPQGGENAVR